ncbi:MAG TPA: hypothetical protein VM290_08385 [Gaiellaceae bacterium]|nr:hypothetical protein [Gaiellaceae bacterium]
MLRWLGAAAALLFGAAAAAALLLFSNVDRALVLDVLLVYAGAVLLQALARAAVAATRGGPSVFPAAPRRRSAVADRPDRLLRLEGLLALATAAAGDFHHGLRPPLRHAAADALAARHGVDLDADDGRARRLLGDEAWELLRADRPEPPDRFARGPSLDQIERTVAAIERIAA